MHKSKVTAFIIKLKQGYRSGWIPFDSKNCIGISNKLYGKLFHRAIELKLLRKGERGYFIRNFGLCMNDLFGENARHIKIYDKVSDYKEIVQVVLICLAHQKISQQYASARNIILEKKRGCGSKKMKSYLISAYLEEGILAQVRISCRQIGEAIGVSKVKANEIIHKLKKMKLIKFKFPSTNKLTNDYYINCNKGRKTWMCERQVYEIQKIQREYIESLLLCK